MARTTTTCWKSCTAWRAWRVERAPGGSGGVRHVRPGDDLRLVAGGLRPGRGRGRHGLWRVLELLERHGQPDQPPGCEAADFDQDGDVDGTDYGVFSGCFNGSGNPPACGSTQPLARSGLDNPYWFTGRLTDTLGTLSGEGGTEVRRTQDNRNRTYDLKHGRWNQRDPLGVRVDAPRGAIAPPKQFADAASLYQYVPSNPASMKDPLGQIWVSGEPGSGYYPGPGPFWRPVDYDLLELVCSLPGDSLNTTKYHCDIRCTSGVDGEETGGGGSGPGSSGTGSGFGGGDKNGDPHWIPGVPSDPANGGSTRARLGTCACIQTKGTKINSIPGKVYEFPRGNGGTSNSNALLSTLLRCCGVDTKRFRPTAAWGLPLRAPGWGDSVKRECGCRKTLISASPPIYSIHFEYCSIGCDDLK